VVLDGHLRCIALKELGQIEAERLVFKDDEEFTYNARVNRLNPIAEHKMIMKAVNGGVKPEKIAAVLILPVQDVKASMSLLDGICAEAADLLKDKSVSPKAIRLLRKVTPVRQIEITEFMISANNFTAGYAEALVLGTTKDQLVNPEEPKKKKGLSREDIAKLEEEMETIEREVKAVERAYRENMLNLTLARGYIPSQEVSAYVAAPSRMPELAEFNPAQIWTAKIQGHVATQGQPKLRKIGAAARRPGPSWRQRPRPGGRRRGRRGRRRSNGSTGQTVIQLWNRFDMCENFPRLASFATIRSFGIE